MNSVYERNNIYFVYLKERIEEIYLLIDNRGILCESNSKCIVGSKEQLYDNEDIVIAPIDILLYHLEQLEYLNRDYSSYEKALRKENKIQPNIYKRIKYLYTEDDLKEISSKINKIDPIPILDSVSRYSSYFENRKKDPVLRIYTSY